MLDNLFENESICVLSSLETTEIIQCEYKDCLSVNERNLLDYNLVVMPYLFPGHWVLALVNFEVKSFRLYDPAGFDPRQEEEMRYLFMSYKSK